MRISATSGVQALKLQADPNSLFRRMMGFQKCRTLRLLAADVATRKESGILCRGRRVGHWPAITAPAVLFPSIYSRTKSLGVLQSLLHSRVALPCSFCLSFTIMPDTFNNIFLTSENLAFSMPLILVCTTYVSVFSICGAPRAFS
jgi:hypothetical protein